MKIIFSNPKKTNSDYFKPLIKSFQNTLNSGNYINSTNVIDFEKKFSKFLGVKYCIGVANATDAIYLSLKLLEVGIGDEVITPSHTAAGTVVAILNTGAKPIFADIDSDSFNINIDEIKKKCSKKTKAVIAVHLYGQSTNMDKLKIISKKKKIHIIEDCSQSAGAKYKNKFLGSFGEFGCFSFFPTKNLSCIGDGGAITFNNIKYFKKLKALREYGWNKNRNLEFIGINSRLDEIHAGFLNVKLNYLKKDNLKRKQIASKYNHKIKNDKLILPKELKNNYHVYHLYVVKVKNRNKFINYMKIKGIICGIHYIKPIHLQKYFRSKKKFTLPITESVCKDIVSLPIYPGLSSRELNYIIKAINSY